MTLYSLLVEVSKEAMASKGRSLVSLDDIISIKRCVSIHCEDLF